MSGHPLDSFDIRLLDALQHQDSPSLNELAELISLSASQCSRRINRLRESGHIQKQVTLLNPQAVGLDVGAFVTITLDNHTQDFTHQFQKTIRQMPPVLECHAITGSDGDYLLKVVARNQKALSHFLMEELMSLPGISQVRTALALSEVKSTTALPLDI